MTKIQGLLLLEVTSNAVAALFHAGVFVINIGVGPQTIPDIVSHVAIVQY